MKKELFLKNFLLSILQKNLLYRYYKFSIKPQFIFLSKLTQQLSHSNGYPLHSGKPKQKILVPLIQTSHSQYYLSMIVAKFLSLKGAEVLILICGSALPGCEIKSIRAPSLSPCLSCKANAKNVLPKFGLKISTIHDYIDSDLMQALKLKSIDFLNSSGEMIYRDISIEIIVNDSFTRHFYGQVPEEGTLLYKNIKLNYIHSALISLEVASKIYKTWNPDIVFGDMMAYVDYSPYYDYFLSKGKSISHIAMTQFNVNAVVLNQHELFLSNARYDRWILKRNNLSLIPDEQNVLNKFLDKRFAGDDELLKKNKIFASDSSQHGFTNKFYNGSKNVILFSNIYWDVGLSATNTIFDGIISWVIETIKIAASDPNINLFIKTHPEEFYSSNGSKKAMEDFIYEAYPELPENVFIIRPQMKVNSYDLTQYIDYALVYNGTLGLEYMLKGVPVVAAGLAPYTNLQLSNDPSSKEEYKTMVLGKVALTCPAKNEIELFAFFYFIKTCIPFNLLNRTYSSDFSGFSFESLDNLSYEQSKCIGHISNCILDSTNCSPEDYPNGFISTQ